MTFGFINTNTFIPCALDVLMENPDITESHHIKHAVYMRTFDIPFRHKYTGFEHITKIDEYYRNKYKEHLTTSKVIENTSSTSSRQIADVFNAVKQETGETTHKDYTEYTPEENIERYRNDLINRAKQYQDSAVPAVVYYSGGGDSEMVVQSFLAASVPFHAVCFLFTVNENDLDSTHSISDDFADICERIPEEVFAELGPNEIFLNLAEAAHAFDSSKRLGFNLAVRIINLRNILDSDSILAKAKATGISSPMILTQRLMTDIISNELEWYNDKYIKSTIPIRVEL